MSGSMVDIQSNLRRLRLGEEKRKKKKPQDENIMVCPSTRAELTVSDAFPLVYWVEVYTPSWEGDGLR